MRRDPERDREIRDAFLELGGVSIQQGARMLGIGMKALRNALLSTGSIEHYHLSRGYVPGNASVIWLLSNDSRGTLPPGSPQTWGVISEVPWERVQSQIGSGRLQRTAG